MSNEKTPTTYQLADVIAQEEEHTIPLFQLIDKYGNITDLKLHSCNKCSIIFEVNE